MIDKSELSEKSKILGINSADVQRDYVFGWILLGIYAGPLGKILVLKGGNCLRKAYFPFGRFSGDLDFSTSGTINHDFLVGELNSVCTMIQDLAGVRFDITKTIAKEKSRADKSLQVIEAKLFFYDFFGKSGTMLISIRFDVTEFDRLYLPIQPRYLIHDYSDYERCKIEMQCVKLEEQLASKIKCLLQRRHVADLFDLVYSTLIHPEFDINRTEILSVFLKKTIFGRGPGAAKGLLLNLPLVSLKDAWTKYIVCPTRSLIDFEAAEGAFQTLINEIFGPRHDTQFVGGFFPASIRTPIMEAGQKQTLLGITYKGQRRLVEPYSLSYKIRKDGVGQEYFYGYDTTGGNSPPGIKTFIADEISHIEITETKFEPRYPIEVSKAGEFGDKVRFEGSKRSRLVHRLKRTKSEVQPYTVQCSTCGKKFSRKKQSTRMKKHKDKFGNRCIGRYGFLV
jgi:predicted nucleotidyltransferase component of viral defense system